MVSGHVAHVMPGAVMLSPQAVELLVRHLRTVPSPDDPRTIRVVADLQRLSRTRPLSRDKVVMQVPPTSESESEVDTGTAGHLLGITPAGVRKRIQRQQLPARFDGRRWQVSRKHIERNTACDRNRWHAPEG